MGWSWRLTNLGVDSGYVQPGDTQITQAVQLTDSTDNDCDIIVKTVTISNLGTAHISDFASIEILDGFGTVLGWVDTPASFPVAIDIDDLWITGPSPTHTSATMQVCVTVTAGVIERRTIQTRLTMNHTESDFLVGAPFGISAAGNATTINNPPTADVQNVTTDEDTAEAITLTGNTLDSNALTFSIKSRPIHGVLSGTAPAVTYTPGSNYNGPDSFTFKTNNGVDNSDVASVTIDVTAVNDSPVAKDVSATTYVDTAANIDVLANDQDIDGPSLGIHSVDTPGHRTATIASHRVRYILDTGYMGFDSFAYEVFDGADRTGTATVDIAVEAATAKAFGPGWHMIFIPRVGEDTSPKTVFHDVIDSGQQLFIEWVPRSSYHVPTVIDPGKGYWLYLSNSVAVSVDGISPTGDYSVPLGLAGWYQVSTPRWPIPWSQVQIQHDGETKTYTDAVNAGWVSGYVFSCDEVTNFYQAWDAISEEIDPWTGYWMRTYVDDVVMVLPLGDGAAPSELHGALMPQILSSGALLPPGPPVIGSDIEDRGLEFTNEPNPVRDVHTTAFVVKDALSASVQRIKVEVFDQSGRLVYRSGKVIGTRLDWHTEDLYGEYIANGVYFYRMYALIDGRWVVSEVKKLAILR